MKKNLAKGIPGLFLILILLAFSVADILTPERNFSENENRLLATRPQLSADTLLSGSFSEDYEEYLTDQFMLRDDWITLKTYTERAMLKMDINGIYFGSEGYLFEKETPNDIDEELLQTNIERLIDFIKRNADDETLESVYAILAPTSADVLSNKLPNFAVSYDQESLLEYVNSQLPNNFINVRDTLLEHNQEYIYYRTDHHWTVLGAYYAYVQWAQACGFEPNSLSYFTKETASMDFTGTYASKVNLATRPDKISLYKSNTRFNVLYNYGFDMTGKKLEAQDTLYNAEALDGKDKYTVYLRGNNSVVEITNLDLKGKEDGRKLLVIKDSYAHCFVPFAAEHFAETVMIDLRYLNMPVSDFIEQNGITDVLFLYNTTNFASETTLFYLTK